MNMSMHSGAKLAADAAALWNSGFPLAAQPGIAAYARAKSRNGCENKCKGEGKCKGEAKCG